MTAVIAMHPSRFGAIRSLVPFQDFRLALKEIHSLHDASDNCVVYRVNFQPISQGDLLDAQRLAQVARVYGRSAQFDGDVIDCIMQWLSTQPDTVRAVASFSALSLEDALFCQRLQDILGHYEIKAERLCLEMDQTVIHANEEDVKEGLESLRAAGIGVSLQSATNIDLELCASGLVDSLTIGRRHVGNMLEDSRRHKAIVAMGRFASTLGLDLVADGVDSYARLGALIESGVTHAMGPLYHEERFVSL
ncbi:MAG: hypothetical protein Tsb002_21460 [Wenzhouxiangellaceae bacterium]